MKGAISVSFGDSKPGEMLDIKVSQKGCKKYVHEINNQTKVRIDHDLEDKKCPKCGGYMIEKGSKLVCADETCGYVESKNDKEQ